MSDGQVMLPAGSIIQGDGGGVIDGSQLVAGGGGAAGGDLGDGTILYIDPNDPHAAELLQQAGLRLTDDGTVTSLAPDSAGEAAPPVMTSPSKILQALTTGALVQQQQHQEQIITTTAGSQLPANVADLLAAQEMAAQEMAEQDLATQQLAEQQQQLAAEQLAAQQLAAAAAKPAPAPAVRMRR